MKRFLQRTASLIAAMTMLGALQANAQDWKGTSPSDVAGKSTTVYLWNVAKKCFLEKGGRWGTEAVLGSTTNGQAFTVESSGYSYKLKANIKQEGGNSSGYLTRMNTSGATGDQLNYFVDQGGSSFTFTQSGSGYTYTISESGYYMCADYNSSSTSLSANDAIAINAFYSNNKTNDVWILVTEQERKDYFSQSTEAGKANAGGTFLIKDYDFARKDYGVSNWKIADGAPLVNGSYSDGEYEHRPADYAGTAATYTYTYEGSHTYSTFLGGTQTHNVTMTSETDHGDTWTTKCDTHRNAEVTLKKTETTVANAGYTYYVGNGLIDGAEQAANGGKWTANIHGANGKVYQTITVPVKGTYRIKCKGFTTAEGAAVLYATSGSKTSSQALATSTIDVTTATYVNAYEELQKDGYNAVVTVYADENGTITFGIEVKDGQADGWASFDDFELEYIGTGDVFVILDETKESVAYLQAQNDDDKVKATKPTVYLHRSFTPNVWNTIVLPFDLTADEITQAFGAGTRVSKFMGAKQQDHPNRLYFEQAKTIEKDQLYLITPTEGEPTNQAAVTATVDSLTFAENSSYYTLNPKAGFSRSESDYTYPDDGIVGGKDTGNETYTGTTQLEFKGTYIKKEGVIPENSYLLYAGANDVEGSTGKWVFREKTSSSRAFRGWLQRKTSDSQYAAAIEIFINGEQAGGSETTAIMDALFPETTTVSGDIYTISGQLVRHNATTTEGLPKGLYIVGGKKYIVK